MSADALKKAVAHAALDHIKDHRIIGVGTGSTVNHFIDALADYRDRIDGAVSSSDASTARLKALGIEVFDLNAVGPIGVYVDGADETNHDLQLIKGGGAALTREKIIAAASECFVCIADASKLVKTLGAFALPVEVIPMARSHVARQLVKLGGDPVYREGVVTDNGNIILDVHDMDLSHAVDREAAINQIVGVVTSGLFAARPADVLLLGTEHGVKSYSGRVV